MALPIVIASLLVALLFGSSQGNRFVALTGGFEYTFSNLRDLGLDLDLLVEYLYDGHDKVDFGSFLDFYHRCYKYV